MTDCNSGITWNDYHDDSIGPFHLICTSSMFRHLYKSECAVLTTTFPSSLSLELGETAGSAIAAENQESLDPS